MTAICAIHQLFLTLPTEHMIWFYFMMFLRLGGTMWPVLTNDWAKETWVTFGQKSWDGKQKFCKWIIRYNNEKNHSHFYFLLLGPVFSGPMAPYIVLWCKVHTVSFKNPIISGYCVLNGTITKSSAKQPIFQLSKPLPGYITYAKNSWFHVHALMMTSCCERVPW